eukprot:CAMPEP_0181197012 /NCGR_PEP_ID=MMETSP1096-20121128/15793_1 /TAXON_ID=156174 ORGANISM="Chrysochromulina ericina, Strain CCMP281" /NCGR_SAMPLE_ID=MMETSP1096 /ASSEMBLY_ACC=CAM_ASM_000453 /LENGTH=85 /DNA_ID=CAMNT_0023286853 /DNA_START=344 /DNA_END=601 /DNA_ORIENTATION=-
MDATPGWCAPYRDDALVLLKVDQAISVHIRPTDHRLNRHIDVLNIDTLHTWRHSQECLLKLELADLPTSTQVQLVKCLPKRALIA